MKMKSTNKHVHKYKHILCFIVNGIANRWVLSSDYNYLVKLDSVNLFLFLLLASLTCMFHLLNIIINIINITTCHDKITVY